MPTFAWPFLVAILPLQPVPCQCLAPASSELLGILGVQQNVELIYDADSENPYGYDGQWLLREREIQSNQEGNASAQLPNESGIVLYDSGTAIRRPTFVKMECKDREIDYLRVQPYITNSFRDIFQFRSRTCGPRPLTCGRIVLDQVIDSEILEEVYDFKDALHKWEGTEILQRLLEKHFKTGPLQPVGGQLDHNIRADFPCEMHTDYLSRPPFYFLTAIVYLVRQGRECSRCETIFNDDVTSGAFNRGHIVQPREGRVALFSGGIENMHCKMPSIGKRDVVQIWFQCKPEVRTKSGEL